MSRSLSLLACLLIFSANSVEASERAADVLEPLVTLKFYWEDGKVRAQNYSFADWAQRPLTSAELERLKVTNAPFSSAPRERNFSDYLKSFLEGKTFWRLARLGIWIRFSDKESYTYYFLPYHRSAAEVLEYFNRPEFLNLRVDLLVDPSKDLAVSGQMADISSHLFRFQFSELLALVQPNTSNMLDLISRLGFQIEDSYSAEAQEGADPKELVSHCRRYVQELRGAPKS